MAGANRTFSGAGASASPGRDDIRISADYEGEGERWTRASRLTLSKDGTILTLDGFRRVRCG